MAIGTFNHNSNPKNAQKSSINLKPSIHNVVSTGKNFVKNLACCVTCLLAVSGSQGIVVKMYGRHRFLYSGMTTVFTICSVTDSE